MSLQTKVYKTWVSALNAGNNSDVSLIGNYKAYLLNSSNVVLGSPITFSVSSIQTSSSSGFARNIFVQTDQTSLVWNGSYNVRSVLIKKLWPSFVTEENVCLYDLGKDIQCDNSFTIAMTDVLFVLFRLRNTGVPE